jgi:phenylpyruvate tautomerase PptA (4-oxalocrotonate tautomerase family)
MPSTRISTGLWARSRAPEVLEAVQAALVEALKIPETDRDVVLDVYDPSHRIIRPTRSDFFTRIEVTLFTGRSMTAKRQLYSALVQNLSALGVPPDEVKTVLIEVPAENWGLQGGKPASEIDLGFEVNV